MDPAGRLGRIVHRNHGVIVAAVRFSKVASGLMGRERPDVPRADAEDVCHARDRSADYALESQRDSVIS